MVIFPWFPVFRFSRENHSSEVNLFSRALDAWWDDPEAWEGPHPLVPAGYVKIAIENDHL